MPFQPAVKRDANLRLAVSGPAGSGKTFTLLRIATALGGKIAFVDTEHGSASKYAHTPACAADCADPSHFTFDVIEPSSFDPRNLMEYIAEAIKDGYRNFCCDSLSHYWMGPDGELELVDNAAKTQRGNSFAAWKSVTPIHNKLVDLMLSANIHILVSMRTKTEWVVEKDQNGKSIPRKVGLAPIMRDGIEFEFDVCGDIDQDNTFAVTKSRCSALTGKSFNRPGAEVADILKAWLGTPGALNIQPQTDKGGSSTSATAESGPTESRQGTGTISEIPPSTTPGPLKMMVSGLGRQGAVKEALGLMKAQLMEAMPNAGETAYADIVKSHGLKAGATIAQVTAALIEMYEVAEGARQAADTEGYHATDDDLPKFEKPIPVSEELPF